jgi:hypothetical protein
MYAGAHHSFLFVLYKSENKSSPSVASAGAFSALLVADPSAALAPLGRGGGGALAAVMMSVWTPSSTIFIKSIWRKISTGVQVSQG